MQLLSAFPQRFEIYVVNKNFSEAILGEELYCSTKNMILQEISFGPLSPESSDSVMKAIIE